MDIKVNIGCGISPTKGWINFDNSPSIKLANSPILFFLAKILKLLSDQQIKNIDWNKKNKIYFADATKKIPLKNNTVECLYTSHMLEHLSQKDAKAFLKEALRVLKVDGVLRISVPDLKIAINDYLINEDADSFIKGLYVKAPSIDKLKDKIKLLISGYRHHQWMYDAKSLSLLIKNSGFQNVKAYEKGKTSIKDPNSLDLFERSDESIYIEGVK